MHAAGIYRDIGIYSLIRQTLLDVYGSDRSIDQAKAYLVNQIVGNRKKETGKTAILTSWWELIFAEINFQE